MKRINSIFVCVIFLTGCSPTGKLYYSAPSVLPFTDRGMQTAGFWLSQHPSPDKIILSPEEILKFNDAIKNELQLIKDVTQEADFSMQELRDSFLKFSKARFYLENGQRADRKFFSEIELNMNLHAVAAAPRYGFIVHYADQKFLPTRRELTEKRFDIDFDELQNNALDVGTPVLIVHESRDGKWLYVKSSSSDGWVLRENVAAANLNDVKKFLDNNSFVVIISSKADIFLDKNLTQYYDSVQMGTKFLISETQEDSAKIILPGQKFGYIKIDQVSKGFLSYTPRTIIEQAFKLLNAPYGWGGMYGEQDCSRFLQQIFSTVGINLPRNSSAQGKVGELLAEFNLGSSNKLSILKEKAIGGITILQMRGHILLFLGMVNDRPFAIHAVWGYRQRGLTQDIVRVINRVVVSDLYLGEGSRKGSLLDRLLLIRLVR